MIPTYLCTKGQRFKHTVYEKVFKTREISIKDISNWMANRYIYSAIDTITKKHNYIKTVQF